MWEIYSPSNCKCCPSANLERAQASPAQRTQLLRQSEAKPFWKIILNIKSSLCRRAGSDQNSWSEGQETRSEPLSGSMNETLCRDGGWRRGLGAIWGTDCWNGCSHWCKVHPLFGPLPKPASTQTKFLLTLSSTWSREEQRTLHNALWKQRNENKNKNGENIIWHKIFRSVCG